MKVSLALETRYAERDTLIKRVTKLLQHDNRVVAAWLFGSLGRGTSDYLSDLDLWIVVADDYIDEFILNRQTNAGHLSVPLLLLEAPQNAPDTGAYLMALYAGEYGPQQVDWYWQAQSAASIPTETYLLFDRADLPRSGKPVQFGEPKASQPLSPVEAATQSINFFWVMLMITAKYVTRSPREEKMGLLEYACHPLQEVQEFVGNVSWEYEIPPHEQPEEKIEILRTLSKEMERLMTLAKLRGAAVPEGIVPQAADFLNLVEAMTKEKGEA